MALIIRDPVGIKALTCNFHNNKVCHKVFLITFSKNLCLETAWFMEIYQTMMQLTFLDLGKF